MRLIRTVRTTHIWKSTKEMMEKDVFAQTSLQLRERMHCPFESITRQNSYDSSFDRLASGSKVRGIKAKVKLETCFHLRLLTSTLRHVPNKEVREADPIQAALCCTQRNAECESRMV